MLRPFLLTGWLIASSTLLAQYTATVKTSVTTSETSAWRTWTDKECSINYPGTWTNEGSLGSNALATFFAPMDSASTYRGRITITPYPAAGATIQDVANTAEEDLRTTLSDAKVTGSNATDELVTTELIGTMEGSPVRVKLETHLKDGKAWVLAFIASPKKYDDALYLADAMFMSFALK